MGQGSALAAWPAIPPRREPDAPHTMPTTGQASGLAVWQGCHQPRCRDGRRTMPTTGQVLALVVRPATRRRQHLDAQRVPMLGRALGQPAWQDTPRQLGQARHTADMLVQALGQGVRQGIPQRRHLAGRRHLVPTMGLALVPGAWRVWPAPAGRQGETRMPGLALVLGACRATPRRQRLDAPRTATTDQASAPPVWPGMGRPLVLACQPTTPTSVQALDQEVPLDIPRRQRLGA